MSEFKSATQFAVAFNMMKMRYQDYDESLSTKKLTIENREVNVFINFETVLKHLSMIQDLEKKVVLERELDTLLTSSTVNLLGHYKRFFTGNKLIPKVYLYMTDLTEYEFGQNKYNEDYRSYYMMKYNENPKFSSIMDIMKGNVLPDVKTYCDFIPNVYFIQTKGIESSLVPYVIAKQNPLWKNFIITGDFYDTQYSLLPGFVTHYIHRGGGSNVILSSLEGYIREVTKNQAIDPEELKLFENHSIYCMLLATIGDKLRSIDGIGGVGIKKLIRYIKMGIQNNIIQSSTTSPVMLGEIFADFDHQEEIVNNYYCISIPSMYEELLDTQKTSIYNQVIDRIDMNSLQSINNTKFANYPIVLEALF